MELQFHCQKSKILFGEDGVDFHKWIDKYKMTGYRHRQVLHHKEGIEVGVQLFGEGCRRHLEQHIKDDYNNDKIPTIKQLRQNKRTSYPVGLVIKVNK